MYYFIISTLSVSFSFLQDTQEFLRCLMDQLHEELKEPLTECNMSGDGSDGDDRRDGDRSPSEDEFLSCDSGSSSDRGEGGGIGEGELLLQDECDGVRSPSVVGSATLISEKERLKEKRVSGSPLRGASQEMDEDADVDTAAEEGAPERGEEEEEVAPSSNAEVQNQENNQTSNTVQRNNTSGRRRDRREFCFNCAPINHKLPVSRAGQRSINDPTSVYSVQPGPNLAGAPPQAVIKPSTFQPPPLCRSCILLKKR